MFRWFDKKQVLFDNGKPSLWLCTSKDGLVTRKQRMQSSSVSSRFRQIMESSKKADEPCCDGAPVAVAAVRFESGTVQLLRQDTFDLFMERFEGVDTGIRSLHCFVHPRRGVFTVYRNRYVAMGPSGRAVTSSGCFDLPAFGESDSAVAVEPDECELRPTGNSTINQLLDLATSNVVQCLNSAVGEAVVREVVIDYVVDSRSQLWMLWVDRAVLASDTDEPTTEPAEHIAGILETQPTSSITQRHDTSQQQDRQVQQRTEEGTDMRHRLALAASQIHTASKTIAGPSRSTGKCSKRKPFSLRCNIAWQCSDPTCLCWNDQTQSFRLKG